MRALQVDMLQRRRDLADGCKGLSSGSPLPMEFHSSSIGQLKLQPVSLTFLARPFEQQFV